jgi:hypothetical protein
MTQYNKKRHLELLKKREEKSISSTESKELSNYSGVLDTQLDWETRDQYLQLLEEFIEGKIAIGEFLIAFEERVRLNGEVLDILESNLILLEPHEKASDFLDFLCQILENCRIYNPDSEPFRYEYELDETEFRNFIEETYLQIQKLLEE